MTRSTAFAAAAATLVTILAFFIVGQPGSSVETLSTTLSPSGGIQSSEHASGSVKRIDPVLQEASRTLREEIAASDRADDTSEPWLRVVPDIELHGMSTQSALEYYWGEELPEMIEYLGIHDARYLAQGFPKGRKLGDIREYLERAKVHTLSKLSAPLESCDTLAPGLQAPAHPLSLLLLRDPKIGIYELLVEGHPGIEDESLASALLTFSELRTQYLNLRLELQARIVDVVSRDLREISVTTPPVLGSIFVSPATAKVNPHYASQFAQLPLNRRRWFLSETFFTSGMNTYYTGMYALQLDLDPVLSGYIADFETQEARILLDLQNLESSF